jgi:hypothetical protein
MAILPPTKKYRPPFSHDIPFKNRHWSKLILKAPGIVFSRGMIGTTGSLIEKNCGATPEFYCT